MNRRKDLPILFGQVIEELRKKKGLSQERLALEAGIDRTFVWRLARGLQTPSLESIFRLAEALDVLPESLVKEVRERAIKQS